jgi:hypothetical protein
MERMSWARLRRQRVVWCLGHDRAIAFWASAHPSDVPLDFCCSYRGPNAVGWRVVALGQFVSASSAVGVKRAIQQIVVGFGRLARFAARTRLIPRQTLLRLAQGTIEYVCEIMQGRDGTVGLMSGKEYGYLLTAD